MALAALSGMAGLFAGGSAAQADCGSAPDSNRISVRGLCLSFSTYGEKPASGQPALFVALHGDLSSGGPADHQHRIAQAISGPGVIGVGLIRPGYADSEGRSSSGVKGPDTYNALNVDAVADVIEILKKRFDARRVVASGHSGGAAHVGVIIGRRPGLIDSAILVSCPCDIPRWRAMRKRSPWSNSLSPHDYLQSISSTTRVFAITGEKDDNTFPVIAQDYVAALASRGVAASFEMVPGAGHDNRGALRDAAMARARAEAR